MTDPCDLTATEAAAQFAKGEICAVELCESCIAQTERREPWVRAFAHFDPELALRQARALDKKAPQGPLHGVPFGVKDIFNTLDLPTEMGSPVWRGFTPGNDARAVAHLKWAGGVMFGKTVTAEFAVHHPGPTRNPWNPDYSPGTSSSGSAAAVAARMVPLALGTQTAGSTIRPASYCGVYGFKPTFGVVPRTGVLKTLDTLDHVCFLARCPEDILLAFEAARVRGPNHPYVHKGLDGRAKQFRTKPIRVAFVKGPGWECAERYAQEAVMGLANLLGHRPEMRVAEALLPSECYQAHDLHEAIYTKALSYYFKEEVEAHPDLISPTFLDMAERGRRVSPGAYRAGLGKQRALAKKLDDFFADYDIIVNLSTAREAPLGLDGQDVKDNCLIWTLCHAPALNVPLFRAPVEDAESVEALLNYAADRLSEWEDAFLENIGEKMNDENLVLTDREGEKLDEIWRRHMG